MSSILIKGTTTEDLQLAMLIFSGHKIMELSSHGDLVDRDAIVVKGRRVNGKMFLYELLKNMPVVIPAERSEE